MKSVLVIVNPKAGTMRAKNSLYKIIDPLCRNGYLPTVYTTGAKGDAFKQVVSCGGNYDLIICCGGDGTMNEVASGIVKSGISVPAGYIPSGSTNDMATSLGLPKTVPAAVLTAINGTPVPHDIGCINGSSYFAYVASFGAFTDVSYSTPQNVKNTLGHLAYILEGVKRLGDIRPIPMEIKSDSYCEQGEFLFGAVSNATSVAGMVKLDQHDVSFNDGLFEVLLIRNTANPLELQNIIYNISKQKYTNSHIKYFKTRHISMKSTEPVGWTTDGEECPAMQSADIWVIPEGINIVR